MGWVSLFEDALERIQENIHLVEASIGNSEVFGEDHRRASLKALADARVILAKAWEHLELATSPELDFAHRIKELEANVSKLEIHVRTTENEAKKFELESANHYAELQDAKIEIKLLKKEKRKLEKQIEKMVSDDFGAAVEVFSSPGMMKKHKPIE